MSSVTIAAIQSIENHRTTVRCQSRLEQRHARAAGVKDVASALAGSTVEEVCHPPEGSSALAEHVTFRAEDRRRKDAATLGTQEIVVVDRSAVRMPEPDMRPPIRTHARMGDERLLMLTMWRTKHTRVGFATRGHPVPAA